MLKSLLTLHQQCKQLQQDKNHIDAELATARALQQSSMPQAADIIRLEQQYHLTIASHYQPVSALGGDSFGIEALQPHLLAFWMADFSGHGIAAAMQNYYLQSMIKSSLTPTLEPGDYLGLLNDKICQWITLGQSATLFYALLNTHTSQLRYASAGFPHPILWQTATHSATFLQGVGLPLGMQPQHYPTLIADYAAGDMLILYSDALIETAGQNGHYADEKTLIHWLNSAPTATASLALDALLSYFALHNSSPLKDDLTLLVCQRNKTQPDL